ncbi:4'-phosphopantetheinyl transferase superfamily protein [Rhodanobacter sp. AS-Z3]|uniref:4'-phosphopantetheinyl transferase family protein n=1 Tax=Rhodanobacter sp. AS-Z3 TaxID=3031330 RepID=UPI00247B06FB|nr:4'-phosphopantetheinyl transferase superfamily protein [Rhodanobacter sp. AS-Z3]WEN15519.1 4'-phosphopantetheinyl transferase superfamily protein [Rhodanobacter sp. AS-Z3]
MIATSELALANVADTLRDDEIHVWLLEYQPSLGRLPLCSVLASYLGSSEERVELTNGEHGRPALAANHDQSLGFNWSHSGNQALIAVARRLSPGIDLERVRPRPRALALAQRFFSPHEAASLAALTESEQTMAFLELWTAKEAVVKALGRGIAFGLDRFSVTRGEAGQLELDYLLDDDASAWQLQQLALGPELVAALAWRGGPRRIRVGRLFSQG